MSGWAALGSFFGFVVWVAAVGVAAMVAEHFGFQNKSNYGYTKEK